MFLICILPFLLVVQVNLSQELTEALHSRAPYPINLESMVELLQYKHISSLTTHLKRHFKKDQDYRVLKKKAANSEYHISVNCFLRICGYCRHNQRKQIAQAILILTEKMGINKNSQKRRIAHDKEQATSKKRARQQQAENKDADMLGGEEEDVSDCSSLISSSPETSESNMESSFESSYNADEDDASLSSSSCDSDMSIDTSATMNSSDEVIQQNLRNIEYPLTSYFRAFAGQHHSYATFSHYSFWKTLTTTIFPNYLDP